MLHPVTKQPILSEDHIAKLDAADAALTSAIPVIDAADSIGIDVSEYRQIANDLRDQISAIKSKFVPSPKVKQS